MIKSLSSSQSIPPGGGRILSPRRNFSNALSLVSVIISYWSQCSENKDYTSLHDQKRMTRVCEQLLILSSKSWCWRTITRDNTVTRVNNVIVANTITGNVKHLFSSSTEKLVIFLCTGKKILVHSESYWSSHTPRRLAELAPCYWGALRCPS